MSASQSEIVYIVGEFPAASQTFILREIRALLDLGLRLRIFALGRAPASHLEPRDRAWTSAVELVPTWPTPSVVLSHLGAFFRGPRKYLRAWWEMTRLPHRPWYLVFRAWYLFMRTPWIVQRLRDSAGICHVHAHFAVSQTEVALGLATLLGTGFSFTGHARDLYATPNALPEKIQASRFVVTCTAYNASYLRSLCPDLDPRHVVLIRHGVEIESQPAPGNDAGSRRSSPPLLLTAGRLIEKKGFDVLIAACSRLASRGIEFTCIVAGDGPLQAQLADLIRKHGLEAQVTLAGWQSASQMTELYRRASAFVLPSRVTDSGDRDGTPNVLIEALSFALPCVSTAVSGIPEIIEHERTGILVPNDDPEALAEVLEKLLRQPEFGRQLGLTGRQLVLEEFELQRNARKLADLFAERIPLSTPASDR